MRKNLTIRPGVEALEPKIALDGDVADIAVDDIESSTQQAIPIGPVNSGVPPQPPPSPLSSMWNSVTDALSKVPSDLEYMWDAAADALDRATQPVIDYLNGGPTVLPPPPVQPAPDLVPDVTRVADSDIPPVEITPARIPGDDLVV